MKKADTRLPDPARKKHPFLEDLRKNWVLWLMLVPVAVFFIINSYLPMVGIYFAFTNFNFKGGLFGSPFVGFKNFEFLWKSNTLGRLVRNTILYNIVFVLLGNVMQIFMAVLLSQLNARRFKKISQTLIFMPYFTSYVILSVIVYNALNFDTGYVNGFLNAIGHESINFYAESKWWPFFITFFHIWKGLGYGMVVYLAAILGISPELHEAAIVDGATVFQRIRFIILPQIKPTFIILLLYAVGSIMRGQFQLFYQIIGSNGLLYPVSDILDTYVYRTTLSNFNFGMGTAAGAFQSVFGLLLVLVVNGLIKRKNPEYALF